MNVNFLAVPGFSSDVRAFWAVVRREWTVFVRYPSWIVSLLIWPIIFPMGYLLTARALSGVDGSGLTTFQNTTGLTDYVGYIAVGTMIWMWQNIVLWSVGYSLRNEQMRGTLESNWLSPTWRFSYLLGSSVPQMVSMITLLVVSGLEYALFFGVICICKYCHYDEGSQCICVFSARHCDDLLRDHLPNGNAARVDASHRAMAAADLHHPRCTDSLTFYGRLRRHFP
ncbi:ABC transporter permease [Candidatus Villigracilis affinis]|uniref:ABC transporter permease n=1 Tax=Candidatus Villigracilis affinis TaxID=3140682 RepID=UPI0031EA182F